MQNTIDTISGLLASQGYRISETKQISYGVQITAVKNASKENIRVYQNLQGRIKIDVSLVKDTALAALVSLQGDSTKTSLANAPAPLCEPPLIGTDEAGKGDFFGPLCVAGVYCSKEDYQNLASLGVRDSKELSGSQVSKLAAQIKKTCPIHKISICMPQQYNALRASYPNLNDLLSAMHAETIADIASRQPSKHVLVDKFTGKKTIPGLLKDKMGALGIANIIEAERAERNLAVAAASILARDAFVTSTDGLSKRFGQHLPLGASRAVDLACAAFIGEYGKAALAQVAKLHFKNLSKGELIYGQWQRAR
ncbi:MAG: ribonuclease HIII [Eubacteriaceae bacterium]|nr:ribonuclease HIII [Eubacteriaceae bacterium]